MYRRKFSRTSPRRKIEWSGAYIQGAKTYPDPIGADYAAEWVRVPSGAYDPTLDNYEEENETLIRLRVDATMLIAPSEQVPVAFPSLGLGIIAWPSIFDDATVPTDIPSPSNPTFPWIWRWTLNPALISPSIATTGLPFAWSDGTHNGPESVLDVRSQRKLPPGTGLLFCAVWETNIVITGSGTLTGYFAADVRYAVKQA